MKRKIVIIIVLGLLILLGWRFIRPMNIFVVDNKFAWPVDTTQTPSILQTMSAKECGACHEDFYQEWRTAMHSQAWTDPYFQTDWRFDGQQHVCRLCHTPLDRQQPHKVLGYEDKSGWNPILEDNPDFDPGLQHEGVTCAACHYRDGKIVGVMGNTDAPHAVKKLTDANQVCLRCHVVKGERWDTFYRFPPCGTVAEIEASRGNKAPQAGKTSRGKSGEVKVNNLASLGCVECHMPLTQRPLVKGGKPRQVRRHLWRGGHDPAMVKKALTIELKEVTGRNSNQRVFFLTLVNTGAAHYVPTGTPDRHLTVRFRVLDSKGKVLEQQQHKLIRKVLWRPFIVDLWDTRLPRWKPRSYQFKVSNNAGAAIVEAIVRYHLLDEKRRKRIAYQNKEPISYEVYRKKISLDEIPQGAGL